VKRAEKGDHVMVHYVAYLEDGNVLNHSFGNKPLSFTVGRGETIAGLEKAVLGMKEGQKKFYTISPEDAYGYYDPNNIKTYEKSEVIAQPDPHIGMTVKTLVYKIILLKIQS
jgi:FKBP-type peptidyl-prolyl cis-trans isomerase 2